MVYSALVPLISFKTNAISLLTGGRGFPERIRPSGDRYQDSPRDRGAPWDVERRRERDHPRDSRDRSRPHEEPRDKDRRPRGELSPGRGPRHWEDRRGGECLYHFFRPGSLGRFPFDQIFWFEIPGIPCDECHWLVQRTGKCCSGNSIFRCVGLTNPRSSGSKFRAKIRDQTEDSFTFAFLLWGCSTTLKLK